MQQTIFGLERRTLKIYLVFFNNIFIRHLYFFEFQLNSIPKGRRLRQGCQMVYFRIKNCNLGTFCRVLQWKMLVYFLDIGSILLLFDVFYIFQFGIFCANLVYFFALVLYIVPRKIWQPWFPWPRFCLHALRPHC
jgi:hypothetical protein